MSGVRFEWTKAVDELRPDYKRSDFGELVRGKYAARIADVPLLEAENMAATVAELTPAELRALIAEVVDERLVELLGDPDEGLELRSEFVQLIQERIGRYRKEAKTVSLSEAFGAVERR